MVVKVITDKADAHLWAGVVLGISSLMLLFTCISSPIVDSMYLYTMKATGIDATRSVEVGLWGYCVEQLEMHSYNSFTFDPNVKEGCSKSMVGFSLDSVVATALKAPRLEGLYTKAHTGLLVLYPIVTAFSTLACILQASIHLSNRTRGMRIGVSSRGIFGIFLFNSILTLVIIVAFIIQISVIATAKVRVNAIRKSNSSLSFHWGNTIWLSVIAIIFHLIDLSILINLRKKLLQDERAQAAEKAAKKGQNKQKNPKQKKTRGTPVDSDKTSSSEEIEAEPELEREETKPDTNIPISSPPPAYELDGYLEAGNRAANTGNRAGV